MKDPNRIAVYAKVIPEELGLVAGKDYEVDESTGNDHIELTDNPVAYVTAAEMRQEIEQVLHGLPGWFLDHDIDVFTDPHRGTIQLLLPRECVEAARAHIENHIPAFFSRKIWEVTIASSNRYDWQQHVQGGPNYVPAEAA